MALGLIAAAVHVSAAIIALHWLPSPYGAGMAILLILLGLITVRDRAFLWPGLRPLRLALFRDGSLHFLRSDGAESRGYRSVRRYVSRWLVIVELAAPVAGGRTLVVARDMLGPDEFRQLRLWALWNAFPLARAAACP